MSEAEKYLESQGMEREYGNIEISFERMVKHLEMFEYEQSKLKLLGIGDVSKSVCLACGDEVPKGNTICSPCYLAEVHK